MLVAYAHQPNYKHARVEGGTMAAHSLKGPGHKNDKKWSLMVQLQTWLGYTSFFLPVLAAISNIMGETWLRLLVVNVKMFTLFLFMLRFFFRRFFYLTTFVTVLSQ